MLKRSYVVDSIMQDYKNKKKYEQKAEMQEFQRKKCTYCKNQKSSKCEIRRDINGKLMCAYNEKFDINDAR